MQSTLAECGWSQSLVVVILNDLLASGTVWKVVKLNNH